MHGRKSLIWGGRQAFTRREPSMAVRPNSTLTKRWCNRPCAASNSSPTGKSAPVEQPAASQLRSFCSQAPHLQDTERIQSGDRDYIGGGGTGTFEYLCSGGKMSR